MSEPMEDKRLERSVEEIANRVAWQMDGTKMLPHRIAEALQAERDKLRVVEAENERHVQVLKTLCECSKCKNKFTSLSCPYCYCEEYKAENTTLQSQITALKKSMTLWRATLGALHDTIVEKEQELSK